MSITVRQNLKNWRLLKKKKKISGIPFFFFFITRDKDY